MKHPGKIIKKIRIKMGLDINEFAESLNVSSAACRSWEYETRWPRIQHVLILEKFAKENKVPFDREDFFK